MPSYEHSLRGVRGLHGVLPRKEVIASGGSVGNLVLSELANNEGLLLSRPIQLWREALLSTLKRNCPAELMNVFGFIKRNGYD